MAVQAVDCRLTTQAESMSFHVISHAHTCLSRAEQMLYSRGKGSKICTGKLIFSVKTLELLGLILGPGSFHVPLACFGFHHMSDILETDVSE